MYRGRNYVHSDSFLTANWVLTPLLLTSAASASDTDLARQLWLLTPVPPVSMAAHSYQLRPVAVWCAGLWAVVQDVTAESLVILRMALFLSGNPHHRAQYVFGVIALRLIAR